jgi:amino acid adenylation domain-containing protein
MPPEVAGPVTIPAGLAHPLRALASDAGIDDFVSLSACAAVLARRLSPPGAEHRVRVIQGSREAVPSALATRVELAGSFRATLRLAGEMPGLTEPPEAAGQHTDVTILVTQDGQRLFAESTSSSADAPVASCWARSFVQLLTGLVGQPDAPVAAHPLISGADRDRILHGLNLYRCPEIRHHTMTEPFEERAENRPGAIALIDQDGVTLTYAELNERANRLAHFLRDDGAGHGTRVGICLQRSIHQIVAIYAAVKAGATYVPLDAELPEARLGYMLRDCAPLQVLTDPACRDRIPDGPWRVVDVAVEHAAWDGFPATTPVIADGTAAPLHILYTSGTTGRPKGVLYPTEGALADLTWMQSRYPYRHQDAALFKTSAGFDVSIWEIFWPLYHGARLVICGPGGHRDPRQLARLVEDHGVTTIYLTPTMMAPFLEAVSLGRASALRWALCGGEPVTPRIRDTFHAALPTATLINCYGPTEAGRVTDMVLSPDPGSPVVPLGRPSENFKILLLDESLELVPIGMPGEAYIGGRIGLGYAYWRAPVRTAERFVADRYGPPGSRLYRTGDLCRYRDDGVLEHLGRIDRQIKIRGLRIEPGEIESVLVAHPTIADCAVIAHGRPVRLIAFVAPADGAAADDLDVVAIGEYAAAILADHMRPQLVPVPRIPATVNGKIDEDSLLAVWQARTDSHREIVLPADETEATLVDIYRRVLAAESVSVLDTFIQLGGHSLLSFELLDECLENLHARPDLTKLLTGTVREVAGSIRAARQWPEAAGN